MNSLLARSSHDKVGSWQSSGGLAYLVREYK